MARNAGNCLGLGHSLSQPSLSGCGSRRSASPFVLCPGVEGLSLDVSSLVDIRDCVNKELALRLHTDIDSQGTFFTDLNGFQVMPQAWGPRDPMEQNLDCVYCPHHRPWQ